MLPEVNTIFSFEIIEKGKRLKAAENLMNQVKEEGKLRKIIQEEKKSITEKIKTYYGYIVKWVEREDELTYRLINISADINAIREKAKSDLGVIGDFIVKLIEDKPDGISIEETIYTAIRNQHRDKKVIIQGERGKWYIDESPRSIEHVVIHPKYAPEVEKESEISEESWETETREISEWSEVEPTYCRKKREKGVIAYWKFPPSYSQPD